MGIRSHPMKRNRSLSSAIAFGITRAIVKGNRANRKYNEYKSEEFNSPNKVYRNEAGLWFVAGIAIFLMLCSILGGLIYQ